MSYTLTVRIDDALAARLEDAASKANEPVSVVVRRAVSSYIEGTTDRRATTMLRAAGTIRGSGSSATNENVRKALAKRRRRAIRALMP